MPGMYRTKQVKSRSRFYILLSVILVFVLIKWGVPFFLNVVAGSGATRQEQDKDVIPPQIPILSALPEATNSSSLLVEGYTEANAIVEVLINDQVNLSDKAKEDGSFSLVAKLAEGSNRVQVTATDESGNKSQSEVDLVTFDNKPITLTITSPKDGTEFFGKNSQVIEIRGSVNKQDANLIINNSFVLTDKDGGFAHRMQLNDGDNEIKIVVSDKAGNTAEETLKIVYIP